MKADLETEDTTNPFGAFAKVFSALADFFGNPAVQQAGRKLFADLEVEDSIPRLPPVGDKRPALGPGAHMTTPDHPEGAAEDTVFFLHEREPY